MRGTRTPIAATPLDIKNALRSMDMVDGFTSGLSQVSNPFGPKNQVTGAWCSHGRGGSIAPRPCTSLRSFDLWENDRVNPAFVLTSLNVFEEPPMLAMFCGFSWLQIPKWPQGFEFKRVCVRVYLEITAEIRVFCIFLQLDLFNEQVAPSKVSAPAEWIEDPGHLLLEFACGIPCLEELNIFRANFPTRIRQIRIAPKGQHSFGQQSVGRDRCSR